MLNTVIRNNPTNDFRTDMRQNAIEKQKIYLTQYLAYNSVTAIVQEGCFKSKEMGYIQQSQVSNCYFLCEVKTVIQS